MPDALALDKHLQQRRGTTAQIETYAGAIGELVVDTVKNTLVLMSGTAGTNFPLARESITVSAGDGVTLKVNNTAVESTTLANNFLIQADMAGLLATPGANGSLLTTDENGKLKASLDMTYNAGTGVLSILAADGSTVYDSVTIPNAVTALNSVELLVASAQTPVDGHTSGTFIHFQYTLASGGTQDIYLDVTSLIDVYTAGNGLSLSNGQFAVVPADGSIDVSSSGVKVSILAGETILKKDTTTNELYIDQNALNQAVNEVTVVSANTGNIIIAGTDGGALLKLAASNNMAALDANGDLYVPLDMGVLTSA